MFQLKHRNCRPKSKKKKKELCAVCKKLVKYKYIKKLTIKKQR